MSYHEVAGQNKVNLCSTAQQTGQMAIHPLSQIASKLLFAFDKPAHRELELDRRLVMDLMRNIGNHFQTRGSSDNSSVIELTRAEWQA
jgi:hypothetical protein